jgi:molybdopterin synthase catalytic subunit
MRVTVAPEPFDYGAECAAFAAAQASAGAVVTFLGIVRSEDGRLTGMEIEHYPAMTEPAIRAMAGQAAARWPLDDVLVIHRHGALSPGEAIMMVATASRHRVAAFEAAEFLMDYLKSRAPFWKKEFGPGGAEWVAARTADEDALRRWQETAGKT